VARGARIVVSSRPRTPFAQALAGATGRPFVAISPADRLPWYLPPATPGAETPTRPSPPSQGVALG